MVGLAKSAYFASKFLGLEDQFGEGCQTILLNEPALPERLHSAIERAWQNADELREPLQAAALRQIELSRKSYERVRICAGTRKRLQVMQYLKHRRRNLSLAKFRHYSHRAEANELQTSTMKLIKTKPNVFVVDTPHQLLNAIEAVHSLQLRNNHLFAC